MRFFRRFLMLLIFSGLFSFSLSQTIWYVGGPSGSDTDGDGTVMKPWATLQKALSSTSVVDGQYIMLLPGTYSSPSKIVINKSVRVSGTSSDEVFLTYVGTPDASGTFVTISAPGVQLANMTINAQGSSPIKWGIKASGPANTNIYLGSIIVEGFQRSGIDLNGVKDIIIQTVTSRNNGGAGIFFSDVKGAMVSFITTANNPWGGLGFSSNGKTYDTGIEGIEIYGTNSFGENSDKNGGMYLEMAKYAGKGYDADSVITYSSNDADNVDLIYKSADFKYALVMNPSTQAQGDDADGDFYSMIRFYDTEQHAIDAVNEGADHYRAGTSYIVDLSDGSIVSGLPVLSYPINGSDGHPVRPRLEWDAFPGAFTYDIEISKTQPFSSSSSVYYNTSNLYYDIPADLDKNATYYWRIRARGIENVDSSKWSDIWSFTTTATGISETGEPVLSSPVLNASISEVDPKLYWYMVTYAPGITLYEIEYKAGDDDFSSGEVHSLTSTTTQSQLDSLTSGLTFYWRVRAYNGSLILYSAWSDVESFTINGSISGGTVKPIASYPTNNVNINYDNTPTLYWYVIAPVNDFNYEVVVENAATSAVVFVGTTGSGATSYEVAVPLDPASYRWKVRSLKSGFTPSEWSDYAYFTIQSAGGEPQVPIPTHPLGNTTVYTTSPTFYWYVTNYSPEFTWTVRVQGVSSAVSGYTRTYTSASTNFQMPENLVAGEQYQWSVCTNRIGYTSSAYSTPALFNIYGNVQSASRPTASWPVNNAIMYVNPPALYWYITSAAIGVTYNIQLQPSGTPLEGSPLLASGLTLTYFQLTGSLTPGAGYHWRVQSVLNGVPSDWSAEATFTMNNTMAGGLPQPVLIYPVNFNVYSTTPMLMWYNSYSAAVTKYRITIATNPSLTSQVPGSPFTSDYTWLTTPALVPGQTYYWGVQSSNGSSFSLMSAIGEFTVNAGSSPVVPRIGGPDGIDLQASSAMLNWYLPVISTSDLNYRLEYSTSADFSNSTVKEGLQATSYFITGLSANTEYYWRVRSSDGNSISSAYSLTGTFKTSGVTGTEEETTAIPQKFEVGQNYPNPFNPVTNIMVSMPENTQLSIRIYNVLGQEVKTLINQDMNAGSYVFRWNGDNNSGNKVPSGIYIYKVTAGENSKSLKMTLLK